MYKHVIPGFRASIWSTVTPISAAMSAQLCEGLRQRRQLKLSGYAIYTLGPPFLYATNSALEYSWDNPGALMYIPTHSDRGPSAVAVMPEPSIAREAETNENNCMVSILRWNFSK